MSIYVKLCGVVYVCVNTCVACVCECVAMSVPVFQGPLSRAHRAWGAVDHSLAIAPTIHTSSMAATSRWFWSLRSLQEAGVSGILPAAGL